MALVNGLNGHPAPPAQQQLPLATGPKLWIHLLTKVDQIVYTLKIDPFTLGAKNVKCTCYAEKEPARGKGVTFKAAVANAWHQKSLNDICNLLIKAHPSIKIDCKQVPNEQDQVTLDLSDISTSNIFARIIIKGQTSQGKYRIRFIPDHLEKCQAAFKLSEPGKKYKTVKLDIGRLASLDPKAIVQALIQGQEQLNVETQGIKKEGNLENVILKVSHIADPDFNIKNAKVLANILQLVKLIKSDGPSEFTPIVERMAINFAQPGRQTQFNINEICEISQFVSVGQFYESLKILVTDVANSIFTHTFSVDAITKIFTKVQHIIDQQAMALHKQDPDHAAEVLDQHTLLHPRNLIEIVEALIPRFEKLLNDKNDVLIIAHFEALEALLETMVTLDTKGFPHEKHNKLYELLVEYEKETHPLIAYLAKYCKRTLRMIPTEKDVAQLGFSAAGEILSGLGEIVERVDIDAPWHVVSGVIKATKHFRAAYNKIKQTRRAYQAKKATTTKVKPPPTDWFQMLFSWRKVLDNSSRPPIHDEVTSECKQNTYFIIGFARLLRTILEKSDIHISTGLNALKILQKLLNANKDKDTVIIDYRVDIKYREEFNKYLNSLTSLAADHPIQEIKAEALRLFGASLPVAKPTVSVPTPTSLFDEALKDLEPISWKIERKYADKLKSDPKFQDELPLYTVAQGVTKVMKSKINVLDLIDKFIYQDDKKTMLIQGPKGSGKSFIIKLINWLKLKNFNPDNPEDYIFLSVSLADIKEFAKNLMDEVLKSIRIENHENVFDYLRTKRVVLFVDAVDEGDFNNKATGTLDLMNLYTSNKLFELGIKVVFVCRTDFCSFSNFESKPGELELLTMDKLTGDPQIYFEAYVKYLRKKGITPKWNSSKEYSTVLEAVRRLNSEPYLPDMLNVATFRKAIACALPAIVEEVGKLDEVKMKFGKTFEGPEVLNLLNGPLADSDLKVITDQIRDRIFDANIVITALRQQNKKTNANNDVVTINADECIVYTLKMIRELQRKPIITTEEAIRIAKDTHSIKAMVTVKGHFNATKEELLRTSCLSSLGDDRWQLIDTTYQNYLNHLINLSNNTATASNRLKTLLKPGHPYGLSSESFNQ